MVPRARMGLPVSKVLSRTLSPLNVTTALRDNWDSASTISAFEMNRQAETVLPEIYKESCRDENQGR